MPDLQPDRVPAPGLPERPPTETERLAVVRALAEARQREEISQSDQLERVDMAVRVETLADLAALVADLGDPPPLPEPEPEPADEPEVSRRGLLLMVTGGVLAAGAVGYVALRGGDERADCGQSRIVEARMALSEYMATHAELPIGAVDEPH